VVSRGVVMVTVAFCGGLSGPRHHNKLKFNTNINIAVFKRAAPTHTRARFIDLNPHSVREGICTSNVLA
jgi:hypothetical protein